MRALFNHVVVVDTTKARHVWEHPSFPQFYVPFEDLEPTTVVVEKNQAVTGPGGPGDDPGDPVAFFATLHVRNRSTDRVLVFDNGPLAGLVRFEFAAMDAWFEEDQEIYVHPKDPYKRIDILPTSRKITVKVDDHVIAETRSAKCLLETSLPMRFYLPKPSLNWEYITPSTTTSRCPYKGEANYYNVTINGRDHRDLLWWYRYPTQESIFIAGTVAPYNEKVDIYVDDQLQERPKTKFG